MKRRFPRKSMAGRPKNGQKLAAAGDLAQSLT